MKAFALVRMENGQPDLPPALVESGEAFNYVLCDRIGGTGWGAYLCAARATVLQTLDEQYAGFIGIVGVTEGGEVHWGELESLCSDAVRDRLNAWLEARDLPAIPLGWSNAQVVREIYERANAHFDLAHFDIVDLQEEA